MPWGINEDSHFAFSSNSTLGCIGKAGIRSEIKEIRLSPAYCRELPIRRVLRDPSIGQTSLVRPFVRILRFPSPLDPSSTLLIRDRLQETATSLIKPIIH